MPFWELPRGRHRIPREVVADNQRQRLLAGVAEALAEQGYARLTVAHVVDFAGVSRSTFYENFGNKRDAVLAAYDVTFERFLALIVRACNTESAWPLKVKAAVGATVDFATAEPAQAQLLVLDAIAADAEVARHVLASNEHLASLLSGGRRDNPFAASLPDLTERALVGALGAIISGRLMNGEAAALPGLRSQLVELVLVPYVGSAEAKRVAMMDPPEPPASFPQQPASG